MTYNKSKNNEKNKNRLKEIAIDILFFIFMLAVVTGVGFYKMKSQTVKNFLGFYFYTVLTESMQDEIPKGSLVITKQVDENEIKVGDDITFMRDASTIITHRVVSIYENYAESGARGFQTKGINNNYPDEQIVPTVHVIGKVVFHTPNLGTTIALITANLKWIVIITGLFFISITSLKMLFSAYKEKEQSP